MLAVMSIGSYAISKTNSLMQMIFSPMRSLVVGEQTWEEKIASNWSQRGSQRGETPTAFAISRDLWRFLPLIVLPPLSRPIFRPSGPLA